MSTMSETFERLTLSEGKFVLEEVSTPKHRLALSRDPRWSDIGNDSYSTSNLGAAVKYRASADERLEKIFKTRLQEHYDLPEIPPLPELDHHQRRGLEWILSRKRSYLAHAPGAGKTAQAIIAACLAAGSGQNIFVCPPGLTRNWEREIHKVTAWLGVDWPSIGIVGRSDAQDSVAWRADFLVVPDSMLAKQWVFEKLEKIKIKLLAVDEASRFKEVSAQRSLALYGGRTADAPRLFRDTWPGIYRKARHVVFLDGSPMPNRPIELFAPVYALDPEAIDCMDYDDFGYHYCGAKPNERGVWEYKYSSNEAELKSKLTKGFMHVVTEKELEHPERRRSMVFMDTDVRSAKQKTWERKHLASESFTEGSDQGDLARYRRELGIRKVDWVVRYASQKLDKKESLLLFAWHRDVINALAAALREYDPDVILGGVDMKAREGFIRGFQKGETNLLILNIAAAGRGYNLQRADRIVFAEFSWSDEMNKQCEKRASRRGSEKEFVRCDYIVAPNSMDEAVLSSLFTKERRVERIIG